MAVEDSEDRSWAPHDHFPTTLLSAAQAEEAEYSQDVDRPLGTYAAITTGYAFLAVHQTASTSA